MMCLSDLPLCSLRRMLAVVESGKQEDHGIPSRDVMDLYSAIQEREAVIRRALYGDKIFGAIEAICLADCEPWDAIECSSRIKLRE